MGAVIEPGFQPVDDIEALELRIEELRDAIARSRRLALGGRASAVVGPVVLLGLMLGLLAFTPARVLIALALMIGGVVLLGSSKSSTEELERSLARAERELNQAIDALGLIVAGPSATGDRSRLSAPRNRLN
jgi:HAMP domain-containing protein